MVPVPFKRSDVELMSHVKQVIKPQLVQNEAAQTLTDTGRQDHITLISASLHWIPVRIDFKFSLILFEAFHDLGLNYFSAMRRLQAEIVCLFLPRLIC